MNTRKSALAAGALAGTCAAALWSTQEPIDRKVFAVEYSDPDFLGSIFTQQEMKRKLLGHSWHLANGALFGCFYSATNHLLPDRLSGWQKGLIAGITEHLATWPTTKYVGRFHPNAKTLPTLYGNHRAFLQATWRHALFGVVLGALEAELQKKSVIEL